MLAGAVLLVLLQSPIWVAQWFSPAPVMLFNFELMLGALVLLRYRIAGWCLVMVSYLLEGLRLIAVNFHFVGPADFLNAVRFAGLLDYRDYLSWPLFGGLLGLAVLLWGADRTRRAAVASPWIGPWVLVGLIALMDFGNGSSRLLGGGDRFGIPVNVAGSPLLGLVDSVQHAWRQKPGRLEPMTARSHDTLRQWHVEHPDRSQLVVLVESMGLPKSMAARQWLAKQIRTPAVESRWEVEASADPFLGTTTYGELRVLCGLQGSYTKLDAPLGRGCLPATWREEGRATLAFHGFSLKMFDRAHWWPIVGLQPQGLPDSDPRRCNATFAGVCDAPLVGHAVAAADTPGRFVYALTLDTHLPLPAADLSSRPAELGAICARESIPDAACDLIWRTGQVLQIVADRIAAMKTPAQVAVMGDHSPPFRGRDAREAFDQTQVPLFLLVPR